MKENVEHSKLIATFMGLVKEDARFASGRSIESKPGTFTDYDALGQGWFHYHSSWDALIPVIGTMTSKMEALQKTMPVDEFTFLYIGRPKVGKDLSNAVLHDDIETAFKCMVQNVNWYNDNLRPYEDNND